MMTEKEKKFKIIVIIKKRHESFGTLKTFTNKYFGMQGCAGQRYVKIL